MTAQSPNTLRKLIFYVWNGRMNELEWNKRPWHITGPNSNASKPIYVAVGGVTGSGKSTLVRQITNRIELLQPCMSIDERETHHPFLDRLFFDPERYSFQIQLNFMVQRVLLVKRWLDAGYSLVMERSHQEDPVFPAFLLEAGLITRTQHDAYMEVWTELALVTPSPNLLVMLNVTAEQAISRIKEAEDKGERPKEFPDEIRRKKWIEGWCSRYRIRIEEMKSNTEHDSMIEIISGDDTPDRLADIVIQSLTSRGLLHNE